ncbi:MAG: radical SAM protein [Thermoactinomyces sp.]
MQQDTGSVEDPKLPVVEIFETVEGEGTRAGFPTTFVRLFHCNLRCVWCDTPYSYAPYKPEYEARVSEIVENVKRYPHPSICLTGGEPLLHGQKAGKLIKALAEIDYIEDIHIETNGSISLEPFVKLRKSHEAVWQKVRFILDYKLPASGENRRMILKNFAWLREDDEVKFVIASDKDFLHAKKIVQTKLKNGIPLFSPVWEQMEPARLARLMLKHQLGHVKLNLQMHKVIWDPNLRGV